jgi:hypothetical protein
MQINWEEAINQIFEDRLNCPRCNSDYPELMVAYSRHLSLNRFAPRHKDCHRGDECEALKLITLCEACAGEELLIGSPADEDQMLETYMLDCRRDLEESLDYVSGLWRDDYEFTTENLTQEFEEIAPEVFREETTWRARLETEYLRYHLEFRARQRRIPHAGWRAEYVEELRALGYDSQLGD